MERNPGLTYQTAGVDSEAQERSMPLLTHWIEQSFKLRSGGPGAVMLPLGYFANVLDLGGGRGLAVSTDGVGTKALVAQTLDKYDTIGIDCVAMNANDVLCVGAEPIAMLDYIAVERIDGRTLGAIAKGLFEGARMAGIAIPGGEIAQVKEMLRGAAAGRGFDIVGTCIGTVPIDRVLTGAETQAGDAVIGVRSSGIHSNGLSLARRLFFMENSWAPNRYVPELGRTIGEELLEPTRIYVKETMAVLRAGVPVHALAHITSTGFLNLSRAAAKVGYVLDRLPEPHPIFRLIQELASIGNEEMFHTYNMGVGFCLVVPDAAVDRTVEILRREGAEAQVIGSTVDDPDRAVRIPQCGLVGRDGIFRRE
jgi:phosphoribosylformylglycinamidine cyclo-ligase